MGWVSKEQWRWLESHGRRDGAGWVCQKTGADINALEVGRSIHMFGMSAGFGEVRPVLDRVAQLAEPFEGGVFDDGFVEDHGFRRGGGFAPQIPTLCRENCRESRFGGVAIPASRQIGV